MFYIFILESVGTSELLLIGLVALIIFGPRKLPELARMLGKAMNEFRRTTDDFKETWAREVDFEKEEKLISAESNSGASENSIQRADTTMKNEIVAPSVKEISQADFQNSVAEKQSEPEQVNDKVSTEKRDWL